ncbi:MAG: tyrosine--tRNA ligase [Actinomycetota bacterium]
MTDAAVADQVARLTARAEHVVQTEDLAERLASGKRLRVKLGLDPTAKDVTLGWAVPLRKLREFQDLGHIAVLIVGDFTARIGDPSGKSETRKQLTKDEVRAFADAVLDQFGDILSKENLEVRYNSEWLEGMDLGALLELTSRYTVAQMLERDDFSKRYAEGRPIALHEFMYPLMQGYDSVAVEADVELGGTDQLFNLLVGRHLQRAYGQQPQIALTMPLLVGTDGVQKMSQSLGNYIGIREAPEEMFGKIMSVPDALVADYASLGAWDDGTEVDRLAAAVSGGGPAAGSAKREVARKIVALYHGDDAAERAEAAFDRQFKQHQIPEDVPEMALPEAAVEESGDVYLPVLLETLGLTSSRGEARRLIGQGGVKLNGDSVNDERIARSHVVGSVVQVGKRRFVRVVEA